MGNRMTCGVGRRAVEERLTRPQRLVRQSSDVDYRKLRKLILSHKLAPCFDADDHPGFDLEECPICFLYYPSLNRSRCCAKGICTECFLQMKPSDATRPAQCPFCKTPCYAVEYRGARTEEEKGLEIAEEQKVIEAKIRMQHESENVGCVMPIDNTQSLEIRSTSNLRGQSIGPGDGRDLAGTGTSLMGESFEADGFSAPNICSTRNEEYAVDLEEVMLMEAICQSLQDVRVQRRRMDWTCGSSNVVGTESEMLGSNNNGTLSVSSCQEEYSTDSLAEQYSTDSLAEHSILNLQISGPIYRRSQTDHEPCVDYSSDGVGTETDCFARLSDSGEHNISEHTDLRCCSLINMPSTSNASVGCFLGSNDDTGPSCYHISGLIDAEQPFIFVTESKA